MALRGISGLGGLRGLFPPRPSGAPAPSGPTNTVPPSITGDPVVGEELAYVPGEYTGTGTINKTPQWRRDGDAITGETGATYVPVTADIGAMIDVLETATDDVGSTQVASNALGPMEAAFNPLTDYDWYVAGPGADPAIGEGDDSNDGLTAATAFATPEKAQSVAQAGDTVACVCGSHFRGQFSDGAMDGITILSVGDGPLPFFDGRDIVAGSAFTLVDGETEIWEATITPEDDSTTATDATYLSLWTSADADDIHGTRWRCMPTENDLADAQQYWVEDLALAGSYRIVIYSAADPATTGLVYQFSSRSSGIYLRDNCTVRAVQAGCVQSKNGAIITRFGTLWQDCLLLDGIVHNGLYSSGIVERCFVWKSERGDRKRANGTTAVGAQNLLQIYNGDGTGLTAIFRDNTVLGNVDPVLGVGANQAGNTVAVHTHTNSDATPYAEVRYERNRFINIGNGAAISNTAKPVMIENALYRSRGGLGGPGVGATGAVPGEVTGNRVYGHFSEDYIITIATAGWPADTVVHGNLFVCKSSSSKGIVQLFANMEMTNNFIAIKNRLSGNRVGIGAADATAVVLTARRNIVDTILQGYEFNNAGSTVDSDENNFVPSGLDMRVATVFYADIAAYKTGTGQDANSITDAHQITDNEGTQEPIFTQNPAAQSAINGWGPDWASFTFNLNMADIIDEIEALTL